jgi:hypothetical protein
VLMCYIHEEESPSACSPRVMMWAVPPHDSHIYTHALTCYCCTRVRAVEGGKRGDKQMTSDIDQLNSDFHAKGVGQSVRACARACVRACL